MAANTFDPKFGAILAIGPFQYSALATTTSDNTNLFYGAADNVNTQWTAPGPGSVVGLSVYAGQSTGGVSAGSVIFRTVKNDTEIAVGGYPTATLNATNTLKSYGVCRPGLIRFAAGDALGISLAGCNATLMPTASILPSVTLYVALDPEE
jgi:hypothetical protein